MSDLTCDLSGLTAKNLLKLSSLCDENGNAYLKTDYSAEIPPTPLNIVTSCPCEFWFDGQDENTVHLFGITNRVLQWDDKSGNARHVANAVDAQRPTWNPATGRLTFVAANSTYLQLSDFDAPLAQPTTIYILYKINIYVHTSQVFTGGASDADRQSFYMSANNFNLYAGVVLANGATDLVDNIHYVEFNGIASNYWINGINVAAGNIGAAALDGITLGAHPLFHTNSNIEIMEVFGYNCLLTPAEHTALNAYLTSKWGL